MIPTVPIIAMPLAANVCFNLVIEKLMIPTNVFALPAVKSILFQSRNRETYDSNVASVVSCRLCNGVSIS